jgi:3-phenylpropionate/cinnamic acid dioxygenase small subunit
MSFEGDAVRTLIDRQEIIDLLTRYATAVDTRDWDLLASVFTPDAYCDYTESGWIRGTIAEIIQAFRNADKADDTTITQHIMSNHVVDINGDRGQVRAYLHAQHALPMNDGSKSLYTVGGIYTDDVIRRDDGWKIARLHLRNLWTRGTLES